MCVFLINDMLLSFVNWYFYCIKSVFHQLISCLVPGKSGCRWAARPASLQSKYHRFSVKGWWRACFLPSAPAGWYLHRYLVSVSYRSFTVTRCNRRFPVFRTRTHIRNIPHRIGSLKALSFFLIRISFQIIRQPYSSLTTVNSRFFPALFYFMYLFPAGSKANGHDRRLSPASIFFHKITYPSFY